MNRVELIESLIVERYGPRPCREETVQEPATSAAPIGDHTDTEITQARRRSELFAALDDWQYADPTTPEQRQANKNRQHLRRVA